MKKIKTILFTLCIQINFFAFAQDTSSTYGLKWSSGFVESGYYYNNLISTYSPYPAQYGYMNSDQNIYIAGAPVLLRIGLTSAAGGFNGKGWYPNNIQILYDREQLKRELQKRYLNLIEKKAEETLLLKQKKDELMLWQAEISEWLNGYDSLSEVLWSRKKDSLNNLLRTEKNLQQADRKKIEESLLNLEDDTKAFEELKNKKSAYMAEANKIHFNDSILQKYSAAKKGILNKKQLSGELYLSGMENLALSINQFQAGRFEWMANPLLSSGATIDGLKLELEPKNLAVGFVGGRLYPVFYWNQLSGFENQQTRYLSGANLGYTLFTKQHVVLHYYYMFGKSTYGKRENNPLMGIEYNGQSGKINYTAYLFASQSNKDEQNENIYYVQNVPLVYNYSFQNNLSNTISQKKSLYFQTGYAMDFSIKGKGILFSSDSWQLKYQRVSPFYQSFAAPFIMRDQHSIEIRPSVRVAKNRLEVLPFYLYREDNLSGLRTVTSFWSIWGLGTQVKASSSARIYTDYRYIQRNSVFINSYQNINFQFNVQPKSGALIEQNLNGNIFFVTNISDIINISYMQVWQITKQIEWSAGGTYFRSKSEGMKLNGSQIQSGPLIHFKKGEIGAGGMLFSKSNAEHQIKGYLNGKYFFHKHIEAGLETGYGIVQYIVSPELFAQSVVPSPFPVNTFANSSFFYGNFKVRYVW